MFEEVDIHGSDARGRLFLHSMPGRFEPLADFLAEAGAVDISLILNLVSDGEIRVGSREYMKLLEDQAFSRRVIRVPIVDFSAPSEIPTFRDAVTRLADALKRGESVLIHCAAGVGRTGTAASCLLSELGFENGEAVRRVTDARSNPESAEQEEFVRDYARRVDTE